LRKHILAGLLLALDMIGAPAFAMQPGVVPGLPPLGPVTIDYPLAYLAEGEHPGDASALLRAGDHMSYRRQDFGGYQDEDAYLLADGTAVLDWSYKPFGPFVMQNGDGGESYTIAPDGTVYIAATQDGGKPGVVQKFDGWVAFRIDATSTPKCFVAPIKAYTCYYRRTVNFPKLGPIDTIVSEHYNIGNPKKAGAMERSFWASGYGRLVWQSWNRGAAPVDPARCPSFDGFNTPPQPDLVLADCRESINIVPQTTPLDPAQLWHP
jgi:hypothetical protein